MNDGKWNVSTIDSMSRKALRLEQSNLLRDLEISETYLYLEEADFNYYCDRYIAITEELYGSRPFLRLLFDRESNRRIDQLIRRRILARGRPVPVGASLTTAIRFADLFGLTLRKQIKAMVGDYVVEINRISNENRPLTAKWQVLKRPLTVIWDYVCAPFKVQP